MISYIVLGLCLFVSSFFLVGPVLSHNSLVLGLSLTLIPLAFITICLPSGYVLSKKFKGRLEKISTMQPAIEEQLMQVAQDETSTTNSGNNSFLGYCLKFFSRTLL